MNRKAKQYSTMQQHKGGVAILMYLRTANACEQHQCAMLCVSRTIKYCIASTATCWDFSPH